MQKVYVVYSYDQSDETDGGEVEQLHGVYETREDAVEAAMVVFKQRLQEIHGEPEDEDDEEEFEAMLAKELASAQDPAVDCVADDTLFVYFKPVDFHPKV